jgi:hypothetical protein
MVVIRKAAEGADPRTALLRKVETLGAGEDPPDDLVEIGMGAEQEPALDGPRRHFDQGAARRNEPEVVHSNPV